MASIAFIAPLHGALRSSRVQRRTGPEASRWVKDEGHWEAFEFDRLHA
jgi:hypothetical protein